MIVFPIPITLSPVMERTKCPFLRAIPEDLCGLQEVFNEHWLKGSVLLWSTSLLFLTRTSVSSLDDIRSQASRNLEVPVEPHLVPWSLSLLWVSRETNWVKNLCPHWLSRQGLAPVTNRAVEPLGKRLLFLILLVLVLFLSEAFSIGSWWRACLITRAASHCLPPVLVPSIASTLPALGFPGGSAGKESACNAGDLGLIPELGRSPGEEKWQSTPIFLPGESHGQRSLAGYSPGVLKSWTWLSD